MCYEEFTINVSPKVKREKRRGRYYLVADATIINPGVMNGSKGPIYYSENESKKSVREWNGIPIVVYHPTVNGEPVSARDPDVLDKFEIGRLFRTGFDGKLKSKLWFDEEDTKRIDVRVYKKLIAGESIEVSTGLFTRNEDTAGEFNGVKYEKEAFDFKPDHLAILPDKKGACGIDDGCGVNNELSHRDIREQLDKALRSKLTQDQPYAYIYEVFDDYFVYSSGDKMYRVEYTKDDTSVTLSDSDPIPVERVTTYVEENTVNEAQKKETVDFLIVNCECWGEGDRATLNKFDDAKLLSLKKQAEGSIKKGFTDTSGNTHTWNEKTLSWETKV